MIFFLFLHENICCGYSLEAPRRGASNEYPQHMFSWRNKKNIMWIPPLICSYDVAFIILLSGIAKSTVGLGMLCRLVHFYKWYLKGIYFLYPWHMKYAGVYIIFVFLFIYLFVSTYIPLSIC